MGNLSS